MKAFHGSQELKDEIEARVLRHQQMDEIIQGKYWENGKGCLWGCSLESDNPHSIVEEELGIPERISRLSDRIFERLSPEDAKLFPLQFHQFVPVGANLEPVWDYFAYWLLGEVKRIVRDERSKSVIAHVQYLYGRVISEDIPDRDEWLIVLDTARAADITIAADAAYAAAYDTDISAPAATVYTAGCYVTGDDRSHFYQKMRDKLLELLRAAE